jgi:hypothetical protein
MKIALFCIVLFICTGCTSVKYGEASYTSFLNRKSISELEITVTESGAKKIRLKGYTNDQVEALGIVTQAAVSAAMKAAVP